MSKLKIRFFGRRRDAGGVAVTVGILLSSGVLLGMSALVVDVGQLYVEREQLQSAADAAAMGVALDCVHAREVGCTTMAEATAKSLADLNSRDGVSNVDSVCGTDPHGWLAPCTSAGPANLTACLNGLPENTQGYVQVRTSTERNAAGASRFILPPVFAQTLAGGYRGTTVAACSRVAWGTPNFSFAFAVCENIFNEYTNNGTDLAPLRLTFSTRQYEHEFVWENSPYTGLCNDSNGTAPFSDGRWPIPADFGWEDRTPGRTDCGVDMADPSSTTQLLPDSPPYTQDECYFRLISARSTREVVPVLVIRQSGDIWAEVRGLAGFVVTGYRIQFRSSARTRYHGSCGPTDSVCVSGYFVGSPISGEQIYPSGTSPYGKFGAAPDLGASIMQTVG
jgi:Flp pilus assembly protein TadG